MFQKGTLILLLLDCRRMVVTKKKKEKTRNKKKPSRYGISSAKRHLSVCFIYYHYYIVFERGIEIRVWTAGMRQLEGTKPNDIESNAAVRFIANGRCHLNISLLIALFAVSGGHSECRIRDGIY